MLPDDVNLAPCRKRRFSEVVISSNNEHERLDAAVVQQLGEQFQQERKAEALAMQEAKLRHEQGMSTEPFGKAVKLVEQVTQIVNDIAIGLEITPVKAAQAVIGITNDHDISPVAVDDMVFLAEKLFVAQERFK